MRITDFRSDADIRRGEAFLKDGYLIGTVEDRASLDRLRDLIVAAAKSALGENEAAADPDPQAFLDAVHHKVSADRLNDFRLSVIGALNAEPWVRKAYFQLAREAIESVVGNELCMQRRINLSIQMPQDDSSVLPLHADTWSGDSPFEVVLWIPWTHCFGTKAMYLAPPETSKILSAKLSTLEAAGFDDAFDAISSEVEFLKVDYGQFLLFNQNLPHGNRINLESETRWSSNCRFKGVFTPYADKKLGEFFEPITLRPMSRVGLEYEPPGGFGDEA